MSNLFLWALNHDIDTDGKKRLVKIYCTELLTRSNWTQLPDAGLTDAEKVAWAKYRMDLRNLDVSDPDNVAIPNEPVITVSPLETLKVEIANAVQAYMDSTVSSRGYGSIVAAVSYISSTDEIWAAEGLACRDWRDAVWTKCYQILAEVEAGLMTVPTSQELIAELPVLVW